MAKVSISMDNFPITLDIAELVLEGIGIDNDIIIESVLEMIDIRSQDLDEYIEVISRYIDKPIGTDEELKKMMDKFTEEFKDLRFDIESR